MFVLCAGYEDKIRGRGVCIELSVTGEVLAEDDGDAVKAAMRVAGDVSGLRLWNKVLLKCVTDSVRKKHSKSGL